MTNYHNLIILSLTSISLTLTSKSMIRPQYFKFINNKLTHHGFVYQKGLNVLKENFNPDPNKSCVPGGFYFSNVKKIHKFSHHGQNLWEVYLPPMHDSDFKMIEIPNEGKWRANKIILGESYDYNNPESYKHLNIPDKSLLDALEVNDTKTIQQYKTHGIDIDDAREIILYDGSIERLNWLKKYEIKFELDRDTVYKLSRFERIDKLNWLKNNGFKIEIDNDIIQRILKYGTLKMFNWIKSNDINCKIEIDHDAMQTIVMNGHNGNREKLEWLKNYGFKVKLDNDTMKILLMNGDEETLEWLKNNGTEFHCDSRAYEFLSKYRPGITKKLDIKISS